jgi:serine protease Do
MKYFSGPQQRSILSIGVATLLGVGLAIAPSVAAAQSSGLAQMLEEPSPLLHSSSQGYMGVLVGDVDSDSAPKLKLKEVRGAVVTLIDHDAPAAQAGVRVNDVVLQVNGQTVEGAEQFTRMLREIPAGRTVSLVISRDGNVQTIAVELADRKKMEHDVWNRLDNGGEPTPSAPGMGILSGGGDIPGGGFHIPFIGSTTLNVGVMVEPLTSQMSEYLGVLSGLMIKQVARKSQAETAGLKAFDVILKVGAEGIATTADWDRALRANQGKTVPVTILRDRKQQTVTLQVDTKRHHAELEDFFSIQDGDCPLMAALDADVAAQLGLQIAGDNSAVQSMRDQTEALRDQMGSMNFSISPEQAEGFRKQAEQLRDQLKSRGFEFNQKQMDQFKQQMELFQEDFKASEFN